MPLTSPPPGSVNGERCDHPSDDAACDPCLVVFIDGRVVLNSAGLGKAICDQQCSVEIKQNIKNNQLQSYEESVLGGKTRSSNKTTSEF